ncbi:MAG: DNA translocase FtsK 4TM domain-containing protein [Nitrospirales bacterium]
MGGPTTAKRGDARQASRSSSHLPYEISGILLIALGLLVLLSLLSFAPTDPTLVTGQTRDAAGSSTHNMIGTAGATGALGLFRAIGGSAYLVPLLLAWIGWRCLSECAWSVTAQSAGGAVAAVFFLSGLLHLEMIGVPTLLSGWEFRGRAGGMAGHLLAGGLEGYFANTGAHIILLAALLVSLILTGPLSVTELWCRGRRVRVRVMEWWAEAREVAAESWEEVREQFDRMRRRTTAKPAKKAKLKAVKINRAPVVGETVPDPIEPASVRPAPGAEAEHTAVEDGERVPLPVHTRTRGYVLPNPAELLSDPVGPLIRMTDEEIKAQSEVLTRSLRSFGIEGKVTEVHPGPVVTMYEFEPAPGVKVARIVSLADDLALGLKATSIRIVAPLPGKSVVGIEVPATSRETVYLKEVLLSDAFGRSRSKLTLALGKDIFGRPVTADLRTMPHMLVAGATGAGKSVSLNTMVLSLLFSARPDEVKLLLIDPKVLELQVYDGIPHLLRPVITDPKASARGLGWVVQEMDRRYKLLAEAGVRHIEAYNRRVAQAQGVLPKHEEAQPGQQADLPIDYLSEEARLSAGESTVEDQHVSATPSTPPSPLPYIVVMIDEFADLMMVAPKDVEDKIARLAQMARASGIHLVLATQRPSVDVITGLIKANFPSRVAFQVSSKTDSRTILDANGAEALLGRGDMLYMASGTGRISRVHGSFVPDEDVRRVVDYVKRQGAPRYADALQSLRQEEVAEEQERDEIYEQAKDLVLSTGQASASLVQRRLRVGYPRAARMIERMEEEGLVGAAGRDGRREVLVRRQPVGDDSP